MNPRKTTRTQYRSRLKWAMLVVVLIDLYICGLFATFSNPPYDMTGNPFETFPIFFKYGFPLGLFLFLLILLGIGVALLLYMICRPDKSDKLGRGFQHSDITPYGDAHFEEPEEYAELAQIRNIEDATGKVLGQLTEDGKNVIDFCPNTYQMNHHMFVVGPSGSGKTFGFVKDYFFQALKQGHSLILSDPDGGLFADTSEYARTHGCIVRRLNFADLTKSDGWDCMKYLIPKTPNQMGNTQIFANTVAANLPGENIYRDGPKSLLTALLLRVILGHEYPLEKKNIKSVYAMLQNPAGITFLDEKFDPANLTDEEMGCVGPYQAFKQSSPNLTGNLVANLAIGLQLLQNPLVADILSTDDIDILLPGKQQCVYYCQFPDNNDTFRFLIALFFSTLFQTLIDFADSQDNRRLPVTVEFLLDEFPSCGIFPDWRQKMATIRKRGINAVMIAQDFVQLQINYMEDWKVILDNCATIIALGVNDPTDTAEWLQTRIGETSIEVETQSQSVNYGLWNSAADRRSQGVGRRYLMQISELCKIPANQMLILFQRHNPIYCYTVPHTLFPNAEELKPIKPREALDFRDREKRKKLYEEEARMVAEYHRTHKVSDNKDKPPITDYDEDDDVLTLDGLWSDFVEWLKKIKDKCVSFIRKHKGKSPNEDVSEPTDETDIDDGVDPLEEPDELTEFVDDIIIEVPTPLKAEPKVQDTKPVWEPTPVPMEQLSIPEMKPQNEPAAKPAEAQTKPSQAEKQKSKNTDTSRQPIPQKKKSVYSAPNIVNINKSKPINRATNSTERAGTKPPTKKK